MGPALAGKLGEAGALALRAGWWWIASYACSGPFPLLSGREGGSGNGPALAGKLGEAHFRVSPELLI